MPVHRLIFRADFRTNYDIIDQPGSVMRILDSAGESFWSDLRENQQNRQISGTYRSDQMTYLLTVEPSSVFGVVESLTGWPPDKLLKKEQVLQTLLGISSRILEHFSISDLNRSGLRVFYFGQPIEDFDKVQRSFRTCCSGALIDSVENTLGQIEDYMIAFDGCHDDKAKYHFKAGPHPADQANKYLKDFAQKVDSDYNYNFVCDVDVYESNFAMPRNSVEKWCGPLVLRIQKQIESFEKMLVDNLGK